MASGQLPARVGRALIAAAALGLAVWLVLAACAVERSTAPTASPATRTPPPSATPMATAAPQGPTTLPRVWEDMGLAGKLVMPEAGQRMVELDLTTGLLRTLFAVREGGWVIAAAAQQPSGSPVVMAYAPHDAQTGRSGALGLYMVPEEEGAEPRPLLLPQSGDEALFGPTWSPDGLSLYFVRFRQVRPDTPDPVYYTIERLWLATGEVDRIATNALWPRASPDGRWLVYVNSPLEVPVQDLILAAADGSDPRVLVPGSLHPILDAPVFTPDSLAIVFSSPGAEPSARTPWWQSLLMPPAAFAHDVPSDWWQVPAAGGSPTRLVELGLGGLFGTFSPDGRHFGFVSSVGVHAMPYGGTDPILLADVWAGGSLDWTW